MRYIVFAVPDADLDRVALVPTDPRDGAIDAHRIAGGSALEVAKVMLERCPLHELQAMSLHGLRNIKQRVALGRATDPPVMVPVFVKAK